MDIDVALPEPIDARRAREPGRLDVEVPDGESRTLSPFDREFLEAFRVVQIDRFEDLQEIGLVPERLQRDDVVAAIRADAASSQMSGNPCGCSDPSEVARERKTRRFPNLWAALQPAVDFDLPDHHVLLPQTYKVVSRFVAGSLDMVGLFALRNITVGAHALLNVSQSTTLLTANDITIGDAGRLWFRASAVKVRARTISGPGPVGIKTHAPIGLNAELAALKLKRED